MRKIGDIRVPIKIDGKYKLKTDSPLITKFEEQLQKEERLYEEEERRRKGRKRRGLKDKKKKFLLPENPLTPVLVRQLKVKALPCA